MSNRSFLDTCKAKPLPSRRPHGPGRRARDSPAGRPGRRPLSYPRPTCHCSLRPAGSRGRVPSPNGARLPAACGGGKALPRPGPARLRTEWARHGGGAAGAGSGPTAAVRVRPAASEAARARLRGRVGGGTVCRGPPPAGSPVLPPRGEGQRRWAAPGRARENAPARKPRRGQGAG